MSLVVRNTPRKPLCDQTIEDFRKKERDTQKRDLLTDVFVKGSSLANQDLYADSEEIAKEFDQTSVERESLRRVIKEYSEQKEEKERSHITETFKQCESFDALEQILQGEQRKWCSRRKWRNGRLQAGFHRICKTLDGHETILSAFPQNNEYTSIFCAALKTVIQASVNHQTTIENLLNDIAQINEVVSNALDRTKIFQTKIVIGKFADLYAHIFHFYACAIKWYQSKSFIRMLRSLNKDYYEEFAKHITKIKEIGASIKEKSAIGNQAEIRDINLNVRDLRIDLQGFSDIIGKEGKARAEAEKEYQKQFEKTQQIAIEQQNWRLCQEKSRAETNENIVAMLRGICAADEGEALTVTISRDKIAASNGLNSNSKGVLQAEMPKMQSLYDRDVLIKETEDLQRSILDRELLSSILADPQPHSLSNSMFDRLQRLILSPNSASLWLVGPDDTQYPSTMSNAAACIISVLSQAEPQLIFHFCTIPALQKAGMSKEESGLISLLYSLITQLVFSLKPHFESAIELQHDRFASLDGTMTTWPLALKLFKDLVSLSTPYIICVIDGMEWIDYGDGTARCVELWNSLCELMTGRDNRVFKLLFTTTGKSGTLMDVLTVEEIYQESDTKQARQNPFEQTGQGMIPLTELVGDES